MPTMNLVPASSDDFRRIAERKLPRFLFDYVDGGAYDEVTLGRNVSDFSLIRPVQKVMCDVSDVSIATSMGGADWAMPVVLAPIGMGGMLARRAEIQAKQAADELGVPFTLSTVSICSLEEVAAVSKKPFWFQLYMLRDRGIVEEMLERAWQVGVRTLVFTVDLAVMGERYRDIRNGIAGGASAWGKLRSGFLQFISHPRWLVDVGLKGKPHIFGNLSKYVPGATRPDDFRAWVGAQFDASVTWQDIEWLRRKWQGRLIIKGVLTADDASQAFNIGANAIVVSNHGGRQLDGVPSAISVLPQIRDTLGDAPEILMDGGVRSGLDVFRASASGASGVMIGRPWAYAMAAGGETGVRDLLTSMGRGLKVAMALCGANRVADVSPDMVIRTRN